MLKHLARVKRFGLVLGALLLAATPLAADKIALRDGRVFEGRLVKEGVDEVSLEVFVMGKRVVMTVPRDQIQSHEKTISPIEQYKEKAARVRKDDAGALAALADWCEKHKLHDQARRHTLEAAKAKPDHPAVAKPMRKMGYILVDGAWVDEAEHRRKLGFARWGGTWLPIAEVERRRGKLKWKTAKATLDSIHKEYDGLKADARRKVDELISLVNQYVALAQSRDEAEARLKTAAAELDRLQRAADSNPNARARMGGAINAARNRVIREHQTVNSATAKMAAIEKKGNAVLNTLRGMVEHRDRLVRENADTLVRIDRLEEKKAATPAPAGGAASDAAKPGPAKPGAVLTPEQLFKRASPAVVRVEATGPAGGTSSGTGFLVDGRGTVVTNAHVVRGAHTITVTRYGVRHAVIGSPAINKQHDLARLRTDIREATYLTLSDRKPEVGEKVYAIGTPLGLFNNTLSDGLVSGIRRKDLNDYLIQTTAPISPGCSGGPLLDARGIVLGVTTATVTGGQNLNFAIPAYAVRRMLGE